MALSTSFTPGNELLLRVSLPVNAQAEAVQLTALDYTTKTPLSVRGIQTATAWEWVVVTTGNQLVSLHLQAPLSGSRTQVALVNTTAQGLLAQQARKDTCRCPQAPLRQLSVYNALLQVSFHEKDYSACQQLLELLADLSPCPC